MDSIDMERKRNMKNQIIAKLGEVYNMLEVINGMVHGWKKEEKTLPVVIVKHGSDGNIEPVRKDLGCMLRIIQPDNTYINYMSEQEIKKCR